MPRAKKAKAVDLTVPAGTVIHKPIPRNKAKTWYDCIKCGLPFLDNHVTDVCRDCRRGN